MREEDVEAHALRELELGRAVRADEEQRRRRLCGEDLVAREGEEEHEDGEVEAEDDEGELKVGREAGDAPGERAVVRVGQDQVRVQPDVERAEEEAEDGDLRQWRGGALSSVERLGGVGGGSSCGEVGRVHREEKKHLRAEGEDVEVVALEGLEVREDHSVCERGEQPALQAHEAVGGRDPLQEADDDEALEEIE